MQQIKWDTPIQLSKVYQFSLNDNTLPQPIDWDDVSGQNKMRRFFAMNNWYRNISSVGCSSGTAQGGVLFLFEESDDPSDSPSFVVKLTDAPERVLFAEYVLKTLGKAKVPKSLVVALEWDELKENYIDEMENGIANIGREEFVERLDGIKDDSLRLLHIIFRQQMLTQSTQNDQDKLQSYSAIRSRLKDPTRRPHYLILMKSFARDSMNYDPFKNVIDPFTNPLVGRSYSFVLGRPDNMVNWVNNKGLDPQNTTIDPQNQNYLGTVYNNYKTDPDFWKLTSNILVTKKAFSDRAIMKKVGRVLAADTLLGNSDRFEGSEISANFPNAFFFAKRYVDRQQKGKAINPIGVIDNDAFLFEYRPNPDNPVGTQVKYFLNNQGSSVDLNNPVTSVDEAKSRYMQFVLENGCEDISKRYRDGVFYSNVKEIFENFDNYLSQQIFNYLFPGNFLDCELWDELYDDDGSFFGRAGLYGQFPNDPTHRNWRRAIGWIKEGFADVITEIKQRRTDEYRSVFAHLVGLYGINGYHSDFKTFEVRWTFFKYITVVPGNHGNPPTFEFRVGGQAATYDDVVTDITNSLDPKYTLDDKIAEVLEFGISEKLISEAQKQALTNFILYLLPAQQLEILTHYAGSANIAFPTFATPKTKEKAKNKVKAIHLALVKVFADWLEQEIDYNASAPNYNARFTAIKLKYLVIKTYVHHLNQGEKLYKEKYPKRDTEAYLALSNLARQKTVTQKIANYFRP